MQYTIVWCWGGYMYPTLGWCIVLVFFLLPTFQTDFTRWSLLIWSLSFTFLYLIYENLILKKWTINLTITFIEHGGNLRWEKKLRKLFQWKFCVRKKCVTLLFTNIWIIHLVAFPFKLSFHKKKRKRMVSFYELH